jgi:hypothetical protein
VNQLIIHRTCREDSAIERNQSSKKKDGNAQFSLCCTSTAMPDDESQDRHPAFCFHEKLIKKKESQKISAHYSRLPSMLGAGR